MKLEILFFAFFYQKIFSNISIFTLKSILNFDFLDFFLLAHLIFQLLNHPEFGCIEKIKTISTTFMAASGLNGEVVGNTHVVAVAKFAIALLNKLEHINEHSFNHFKLRIGKISMSSG